MLPYDIPAHFKLASSLVEREDQQGSQVCKITTPVMKNRSIYSQSFVAEKNEDPEVYHSVVGNQKIRGSISKQAIIKVEVQPHDKDKGKQFKLAVFVVDKKKPKINVRNLSQSESEARLRKMFADDTIEI